MVVLKYRLLTKYSIIESVLYNSTCSDGFQNADLRDHDFVCDLDSGLIVVWWLLVIRIDGLKKGRH